MTIPPAELFALNLLEGFDLGALGHNSVDYIHTSAEALKLAFADREKYLGDMDFIDIPYEGLLSKEYAGERRRLIDPNRASLELRPGTPEEFTTDTGALNRPFHVNLDGDVDHEGDTSYIAVVDRDRNMVSFEPSLHSGFGTGVVVGDLGFMFNCRGDYYSLVPGEANALEPGKRPRSTLQSTLVMKDGEPYAVLGSPGGDDQIMRTMQTLLNMVEFDMNVQQAIEAPRWSTRSFPASPFPPHDVSRRSVGGGDSVRGHPGRAQSQGARSERPARVEFGCDRCDRRQHPKRCPRSRGRPANRGLRLGPLSGPSRRAASRWIEGQPATRRIPPMRWPSAKLAVQLGVGGLVDLPHAPSPMRAVTS